MGNTWSEKPVELSSSDDDSDFDVDHVTTDTVPIARSSKSRPPKPKALQSNEIQQKFGEVEVGLYGVSCTLWKEADENRILLDNAGVQNQPTSSGISDPDNLNFNQKHEKYDIDIRNPGVCLIIKNSEFDNKYEYEEKKEMFKNGSTIDQEELEKTFNSFGFKVVVKKNRIHTDMMDDIVTVLKDADKESSVFIFILSQGDRDIVYGTNNSKILITNIQYKLGKTNKTKLKGKPKVLILQLRQPPLCQEMKKEDSESSEDNMVTDGKQNIPDTADIYTFSATNPGFVQALCAKIKELHLINHFADICIRTLNEVTFKRSRGNKVTTPFVATTFRKFLYLPPKIS